MRDEWIPASESIEQQSLEQHGDRIAFRKTAHPICRGVSRMGENGSGGHIECL